MYLTFGVISSTVTWKMADCHQSTHFVRQIVAETIWRIQNVRKLNDKQLSNFGLIEKKVDLTKNNLYRCGIWWRSREWQ